MIKYVVPIICCLLIGCKEQPKEKDNASKVLSKEDFYISPPMLSIIDSFATQIKKYETDSINLVGYIKILESKNNDEFKVQLECITDFKTLNQVNIDHYFVEKGIFFCIDGNQNKLLRNKLFLDKNKIIEKSRLNKFQLGDRKTPSWLFLIKGNKVVRRNMFARPLFGAPSSGSIGYFEGNQMKSYKVDEWGLVYNEFGIVIDTVAQ